MNFSFQTVFVAAVVIAAHLGVIVALKPATLEASKYFQSLQLDGFVSDYLVKQGSADRENPVAERSQTVPLIASGDEIPVAHPIGEAVREGGGSEVASSEDAGSVATAETFLDLEKEMQSMKAVTDVRMFSGRIEEPSLAPYTSARLVAEPVSEESKVSAPAPPVVEAAREVPVSKPVVEEAPASPLEKADRLPFREIRPISRS